MNFDRLPQREIVINRMTENGPSKILSRQSDLRTDPEFIKSIKENPNDNYKIVKMPDFINEIIINNSWREFDPSESINIDQCLGRIVRKYLERKGINGLENHLRGHMDSPQDPVFTNIVSKL